MDSRLDLQTERTKAIVPAEPSTPSITAILFLFILGIYWLSPVVTVTDSLWSLYVSASILQEGNTDLDEYEHLIDVEDDIRIVPANGHLYYYYPIAVSFLATPFVWTANQFYSLRNSTDLYTYLAEHKPDDFTGRLEKFIASILSALGIIPIYLLASHYLSRKHAVVLALIFALSTSMWSTASRALWQHGPSVLFLSCALYLMVLAQKKEGAIQYAGFFIAISYVIRPNNSLAVIFTSLYVLINHKKYFIRYLIGAGLVAVPFIIFNWTLYGALLPPYSFQLFEKPTTAQRFLEALAGTMISPARGLFVFTPVFIFSIYGIILSAKNGAFTFRATESYILAIIIGHWLIISLFADWDGGWSIGPRYFTDIIPYMIFFMIPVFQRSGEIFSRNGWKITFMTLVVISTLIHFRCSTSIYPFLWNGYPITYPDGATYRDWDWTDLQFLRGFCASDLEKGQAPACWLE